MMPHIDVIPTLFSLILYGVANSMIIAALFLVVQPSLPFARLFAHVLVKTAIAMAIVIGFFFLLARSFCWSAWLMQCVECLCPTATSQTFILQNSLPAILFFFLGMTSVQLVTVPMIKRLQPMAFVLIIGAANIVATFLRLGFGALLGW